MIATAADWNRARRLAHASGRLLAVQSVALGAADRRVLAENIVALTPLPARDASAMDGWAVSGPGPWSIVGDVRAGADPAVALRSGQSVTIATGAALPPGATGIVRREHGTTTYSGVLESQASSASDIRRAGEETPVGTLLVEAGTRLSPGHLGLAAAAGHDVAAVVQRPTARYLVLGDELLHTGTAREGKVRDSLGPQVPAWLERMGVDVVEVAWVADTLEAHIDALAASAGVDLVVTSGGTARGPVDFLHEGLARTSGRLVVDTVAVRPGHPMLLGRWDEHRWLLGLPGNPQAAIAALLTLGGPLIAALHGQLLPSLGERRITEYATSRGGATRLVLCTSFGAECTPAGFIGSGMLRGLAAADGFAVVPPSGAVMGDQVSWLPLPA